MSIDDKIILEFQDGNQNAKLIDFFPYIYENFEFNGKKYKCVIKEEEITRRFTKEELKLIKESGFLSKYDKSLKYHFHPLAIQTLEKLSKLIIVKEDIQVHTLNCFGLDFECKKLNSHRIIISWKNYNFVNNTNLIFEYTNAGKLSSKKCVQLVKMNEKSKMKLSGWKKMNNEEISNPDDATYKADAIKFGCRFELKNVDESGSIILSIEHENDQPTNILIYTSRVDTTEWMSLKFHDSQ